MSKLIGYRTAHLARYLKYDEPVMAYFEPHYFHKGKLIKTVECFIDNVIICQNERAANILKRAYKNSSLSIFLARPIQSDLQEWLRNMGIKMNIEFYYNFDAKLKYRYNVEGIAIKGEFKTYEECLEQALINGLKIYKKHFFIEEELEN